MNKIFVTVFPYIIGLRLIKFFHMDGKKLEIFEMPQIFSNFFLIFSGFFCILITAAEI